ncbi:uncharacterized protein G2W53_007958 [Senna tora]|uniref:Uncharacterized protein n=1 Tax=Senna tora TaxID=362788 RepID=A0A835CFE2_9FABA|nr:uncharacterized protein G2W53_007958 [Senna tora]
MALRAREDTFDNRFPASPVWAGLSLVGNIFGNKFPAS